MNIKEQIIDFIKRNRVCTTEVADCLGKSGALEGIMPINQGQFHVGEVKWVYTHEESNWEVHEQITDLKEGRIVFIEAFGCNGRAIIGELVTKYMILYRQAEAIVCNAKFRDAAALLKERYPVWCTGFTPVGCFNRKPSTPLAPQIISSHRERYEGAIAVCDDCGVVIIPKEYHTEDFLGKLHDIENQEDIWFERLDHYKENTFEIVCLKNYLKK